MFASGQGCNFLVAGRGPPLLSVRELEKKLYKLYHFDNVHGSYLLKYVGFLRRFFYPRFGGRGLIKKAPRALSLLDVALGHIAVSGSGAAVENWVSALGNVSS